MVTQLKILHNDKGKGKSSSKTQEAVDEPDYLVTFTKSITQAMARTMQDSSDGIRPWLEQCRTHLTVYSSIWSI